MKKHIRQGLFLLLLSVSAHSWASSGFIELRNAWMTGSESDEFKLGGGYNFDNGAGVLFSTLYNVDKFNQLKHSYNELEGWYPIVKYDAWTFNLGSLVDSNSDGSWGAVYLDNNYRFTDDFNVSLRYRYNYNNHKNLSLDEQMKYNNNHQINMYWNYKINQTWSYTFEPDVYFNTENFNRSNGKDHSWELNNKLVWNWMPHWRPFFEASWLDRYIESNREQYRFRVGIRYYF